MVLIKDLKHFRGYEFSDVRVYFQQFSNVLLFLFT